MIHSLALQIVEIIAGVVARLHAQLGKINSRPLISAFLIAVEAVRAHPVAEAAATAIECGLVPDKSLAEGLRRGIVEVGLILRARIQIFAIDRLNLHCRVISDIEMF